MKKYSFMKKSKQITLQYIRKAWILSFVIFLMCVLIDHLAVYFFIKLKIDRTITDIFYHFTNQIKDFSKYFIYSWSFTSFIYISTYNMKVKNEKALIDMEIEKAQIKAAEETYKVKELELEIKRIEQQKAEREEKINRVESFKNRLRAR